MGQVPVYSCKSVRASIQPMSPVDNDSYLLSPSGVAGGAWFGHDNEVTTWSNLLGWLFFGVPVKGTQVFDEGNAQWLFYSGTNWRKNSQFSVDGSGDQALTGSYVELTNWGTPDALDGGGTYGCFSFSSGRITLDRDARQINHQVVVTIEQTASGNQNDFLVEIEKSTDGGTVWNRLGPETGGNTFSDTAMIRDTGVCIVEDYSPSVGDKYRVAVKHTNGSATLKSMGVGLHWHAEEVN